MKFNKKASVPIGTIAIIIIVLIAGLGMWWFFTKGDDEPDCSDIIMDYIPESGAMMYYEHTGMVPRVIHDLSDNWISVYIGPDGFGHSTVYITIDALEDGIDSLNTDSESKTKLHHIANCIQAGCPDCQET